MFPGVSKSRIWKKFILDGLSLIIGNSRKRHGKGKHEKGMDDIPEEKENENSRKRHGKGEAHELGMDNISEDKRSSGMAPE